MEFSLTTCSMNQTKASIRGESIEHSISFPPTSTSRFESQSARIVSDPPHFVLSFSLLSPPPSQFTVFAWLTCFLQ